MNSPVRISAALALLLGISIGGVQAQPLETHLPFTMNHKGGLGYSGSEIHGGPQSERGGKATVHGIPTAYGAEFGDLFGGVMYQRFLGPSMSQRNDGAFLLGVGVGNARETVGLEITHATYDVVGDPFQDGSIGLKLHRHLYEGLHVAAGVEDLFHYGDWVSRSAYAVASYTARFDGEWLTGGSATVGMGDGRFNTTSNLSQGKNRAGLFGGLSVEVANRVNVLSTWYGQDLNLGMSFSVPGPVPVTITPVWSSVLGKHDLGDRFAMSIGTAYQFQ